MTNLSPLSPGNNAIYVQISDERGDGGELSGKGIEHRAAKSNEG